MTQRTEGRVPTVHRRAMKETDSGITDRSRRRNLGMGQWFSRFRSWASTSEPSNQALKKHKRVVYQNQNAGVSRKDAQTNARLR